MKTKMTKLVTLLLALVLVIGCFTGCGNNSNNNVSEDPKQDNSSTNNEDVFGEGSFTENREAGEKVERNYAYGELVVGMSGASSSTGFDRVSTRSGGSLFTSQHVWDALFVINPDTLETEPQMVKSYEWTEDYLGLNITLHDNITAMDGEPITAEDVIWSMERNILENSQRASYYEAYDFEKTWAELDGDSTTFTLYYKYEYGPGINFLTDPVYPMDWGTEGAGTDNGAWWDAPNSTGPYYCVENVDGSHMVLALVENYWAGNTEGMPSKITIKTYSEQTALYIDYSNGVIDMAFGLSNTDMENVINGALTNTTYNVASKNDVYAICLCPSTEYFQDENVRMAIAHCLNMDDIGYAALGVMAKTAVSTLPISVNYAIDLGGYEYNVELAKEYLSKSAYPNGFTLDTVVTTNDSTTVAIAEMLQFYLDQIGITMNFQALSIGPAIDAFMSGGTQLLIKNCMEGAPSLEPDQIYNTIGYKSTNISAVVSTDPESEFNQNLYNGLYSVDPAKRADYYAKVQQYLYDTAYQIPVCEGCYGFCYRNDYVLDLNAVAPTAPNFRFIRLVDQTTYNGEA